MTCEKLNQVGIKLYNEIVHFDRLESKVLFKTSPYVLKIHTKEFIGKMIRGLSSVLKYTLVKNEGRRAKC